MAGAVAGVAATGDDGDNAVAAGGGERGVKMLRAGSTGDHRGRFDKDYPYAGISTTLDSGAVIEGLQAHGFRLALHGHQHVPGVAHVSRAVINGGDASIPRPDLAILSAGSAGAKGERLADAMRDNSYNLLKFVPGEVQIEARRFNAGLAGSRYFTTRLVG